MQLKVDCPRCACDCEVARRDGIGFGCLLCCGLPVPAGLAIEYQLIFGKCMHMMEAVPSKGHKWDELPELERLSEVLPIDLSWIGSEDIHELKRRHGQPLPNDAFLY